jgi:hypothetical protein
MLHSVEVVSSARRSLRRAVTLEADVIARPWDLPRRHRVLDLSPEGMRLSAGTPLPVGEEVVVCFAPPGGDATELWAWARVVRTGADAMGLELLDLDSRERDQLSRALIGTPPPLSARARSRRELVWIEMLVTYTEDLGDRVNTVEVSEALHAVADRELQPAALSGLLTGGRTEKYAWRFA